MRDILGRILTPAYDCAQTRRVEPGLAGLVWRRERDEEDAVSFDLTVPGLVRRSSPLEMETDRG